MAVPTLPAPAMATFMTAPVPRRRRRPCRRRCRCPPRLDGGVGALEPGAEPLQGGVGHHQMEDVPVLADQIVEVEAGHAGPGHRHHRDLAGLGQIGQPLARPPLGQLALDQGQGPGRVRPLGFELAGHQPPADLVDGPRHGGHGGDAQAQVDLGPPGVVDAGHDVGDLVGLAGDPGRQDVRVVAAGDRGQGRCLVGPGPVEVVAVEARTHDGGPRPVGGEPPEGLGVAVDDGHRMALLDQPDAQSGTDPATTHDDDVHPNHATRIAG